MQLLAIARTRGVERRTDEPVVGGATDREPDVGQVRIDVQHAVSTAVVLRHGGDGAPALRGSLEVQWLTRQLAAHRGNAVIRAGRELEHDGRAFERRAGTPGETRRSRDTLRGRTRHTKERDQRHDRSDNAASHHDHRRDEQQRRQEKWRPRHSRRAEWADRRGEHLREQHRRDHARDPHHTGDRTLQPALLVRPHAPGHQALQRRIGEPEQAPDGNPEQKQRPGRRQAVDGER